MNIKKILALGSCLVLFTSSLTVNAAEMSESKNVKQINLSEKVSLYGDFTPGYYMVTGTGVRFRSEPSLSGGIIATLAKGEYLYYERAAGPTEDSDGYTWLRCERVSTGQIGYVAVNYIQATTPPPGAPYRLVNWNK